MKDKFDQLKLILRTLDSYELTVGTKTQTMFVSLRHPHEPKNTLFPGRYVFTFQIFVGGVPTLIQKSDASREGAENQWICAVEGWFAKTSKDL